LLRRAPHEAVTGVGALEHYQEQAQILRHLAPAQCGEDGILAQVEKLSETAKHLEKELEAQKRKAALGQSSAGRPGADR